MKCSVFILGILSLSANAASAHGVLDGHIIDIRVEVSGQVIVTFDQAVVQAPPECASANPKNMAFSLISAGGNGMLSAALAAQTTGQLVRARGTGACTAFNVFEDIGYIVLRGN